jgi:hypothetical protein
MGNKPIHSRTLGILARMRKFGIMKKTIWVIFPYSTSKTLWQYIQAQGAFAGAVIPADMLKYGMTPFDPTGWDSVIIYDGNLPALISKLYGSHGIIPGDETAVMLTANIAEQIELPYISPVTAEIVRNKQLMLDACAKARILVPVSYSVRNLKHAIRAANIISYPVIMKPSGSASSFGFHYIQNESTLIKIWHEVYLSIGALGDLVDEIVIQQYIPGKFKWTLTYVTINGNHYLCDSWHEQIKLVPKGLAWRYSVLAKPPEKLRKYTRHVLNAVGINHGPSNIECKIDSNGRCYLIEVAARNAGLYPYPHVIKIQGYNQPLCAAIAVINPSQLTHRFLHETKSNASYPDYELIQLWLTASQSGHISPEVLEKIMNMPGIINSFGALYNKARFSETTNTNDAPGGFNIYAPREIAHNTAKTIRELESQLLILDPIL